MIIFTIKPIIILRIVIVILERNKEKSRLLKKIWTISYMNLRSNTISKTWFSYWNNFKSTNSSDIFSSKLTNQDITKWGRFIAFLALFAGKFSKTTYKNLVKLRTFRKWITGYPTFQCPAVFCERRTIAGILGIKENEIKSRLF